MVEAGGKDGNPTDCRKRRQPTQETDWPDLRSRPTPVSRQGDSLSQRFTRIHPWASPHGVENDVAEDPAREGGYENAWEDEFENVTRQATADWRNILGGKGSRRCVNGRGKTVALQAADANGLGCGEATAAFEDGGIDPQRR